MSEWFLSTNGSQPFSVSVPTNRLKKTYVTLCMMIEGILWHFHQQPFSFGVQLHISFVPQVGHRCSKRYLFYSRVSWVNDHGLDRKLLRRFARIFVLKQSKKIILGPLFYDQFRYLIY